MSAEQWWELRGKPEGLPAALRRRFGQDKPPVDPRAIALGIGVEVREVRDRSWSGAVKFEGKRAVIWLNAKENGRRRRFTLAHELGHLMLHAKDGQGLFRDSSFVGDKQEREANQFAAVLLMPKRLVHRYAAIADFDLQRMAKLFDVSVEALQIRLAMVMESEMREQFA